MKYAELHLHSNDQFDAQNNPETVCRRLEELGAKGLALTQHGVLSGVDPMRAAAKKHGLKFIPGIEAYYGNEGDLMQNRHLILLSADAIGYKALYMAVTASQNRDGLAVMDDDILVRYFGPDAPGHGHIIATSACIQGPLAAILRRNEAADRQAGKLKMRYKNALDDMGPRISRLQADLAPIEEALDKAKQKRDQAKKIAERSFAGRESKLKKLEEAGSPDAEAMRLTLEQDKQASAKAGADMEHWKKEAARLTRQQAAMRRELKELSDIQERHNEYASALKEIEGQRLSKEEEDEALWAEIEKFKTLFGEENFFIEVQYHGLPAEAAIYPRLAQAARDTGTPLIAANDAHMAYGTEDERLQRQILRSMRFGQWEEENVGDKELYIKTDEELSEWLNKILEPEDVLEAMLNIQTVFDRCNVVFESEKHYPKFPTAGKTAEEVLEEKIRKGIAWRFPQGMDEEHMKRLEHEIRVIEDMGFSDYHLIVENVLEYARVLASFPEDMLAEAPLTIEGAKALAEANGWSGGVATGPRGSAVGSLACYLLGITSMDPMDYGLMFERFLNPERVTMPDIDTDIAKKVRPKVIQYVQAKYGHDAVCGIMTKNALAPRGAIRTAAKYYALSQGLDGTAFKDLGDTMAKAVPVTPGTLFGSDMGDGTTLMSSLMTTYGGNENAAQILRWAGVLEGSFTTYGAHAAGIVISDNANVGEYIPLRWNEKLQEWTTQCDMVQVEENGLLKFDFLGLKTLDVITGCIRMIREKTGKTIIPENIPLDDERVYREIFQQGKTKSVFQFESEGMRSMLKNFRPDQFSDLILLVAAYRPGPMQYLDAIIDTKAGRKEAEYAVPELEEILGGTYGYPVYQEEVMAIFQRLAGYTLGGADIVRRYMSKKKADKLAAEREAFIHGDPSRGIDGCVARGIPEEIASDLFTQMEEFARYAFNKSHAAAYAMVSYWTAWLKCHYPAEFLAEAMNWAEDDDAVRGLVQEARQFGVPVLPPDVNASGSHFTVRDGQILYGLGSVRGVGENGRLILEERRTNGRFRSFKDFIFRTLQARKNALENLVKAGALDTFCRNRQALMAVLDPYRELAKKAKDKDGFADGASLLLSDIDHCNTKAELDRIQQAHGVAVLDKPTTRAKLEARIENARKAAQEARDAMSGIMLRTDIAENRVQRLTEEKEMLGAYISAHPLDEYESCETAGAEPIGSLGTETTRIMGILSNIRKKSRKKDGKPMAFLELEDKTGSIEVAVFTGAYPCCSGFLEEGRAVVVNGKVLEEETLMLDENGVPITIRKFIAESMEDARPDRKASIRVSSYALFHVNEEEKFRREHEKANGYRFTIYDEALAQERDMKYRVDASVFALPNAI